MFRLLSVALLAGFTLTSCATAYIANTRNAPMFGEANEFAGTVALSSGVDVQAAYSVSDHIALMGNFNTVQKKETPADKPAFQRNHIFGEGGLGYFSRTKKSRFELFAGYGVGKGTSYDSYYFFNNNTQAVITNAKYGRIFIQPSIGTNKKKFNLIFTARISAVGFKEYSTEDPDANPKVFKPTGYSMFFEPSLTARVHLAGNVRAFFQLGINSPIGQVDFNYLPLQGSLGIQIHTGQLRTRVY